MTTSDLRLCPVHGIPDCSPLLNGCSRLTAPATSDPTPVVEVKRFHEAYPGMPLLYHTYCSACPNYGTCGKREAAESDAWRHAQSHGRTATPSDPTPSDHDELLTRTATHRSDGVGGGVALIRELETALRTEQSARQAAEAQVVAIRKWNTLTNGRPRYRELDRLVNPEAWIDPDAAPTESKEPEPKLDPKPWNRKPEGGSHAYPSNYIGNLYFAPRPEFSQNPADYGIEASHE